MRKEVKKKGSKAIIQTIYIAPKSINQYMNHGAMLPRSPYGAHW